MAYQDSPNFTVASTAEAGRNCEENTPDTCFSTNWHEASQVINEQTKIISKLHSSYVQQTTDM